ncbi:MAG: DUF5060 domain-containing protein [Chloroflexi bacterium]|nr:DUF5060 domain-containing protein [Chloroflexota bacterium]
MKYEETVHKNGVARNGMGMMIAIVLIMVFSLSMQGTAVASTIFPHQNGTLYAPYLEWSVTNETYSGNPFDVIATATFVHSSGNETRTTGMFYDGNNTWKFRFAGTRTGNWAFSTASSDNDLNGHSGSITIATDPNAVGFVTHIDDKWIRSANYEAFVPQYFMASAPHNYYNNVARIDSEIQTFFVEHGFNGLHSPVFCRWFDIDQPNCALIGGSDPNPDLQTFEALELLITKAYDAGGIVHLWMWGDDSRKQNPSFLPGGINGAVDLRLQRYIAARLGPLPGWTASYGFDLPEWVNDNQLTTWHDTMQDEFGWGHILGARAGKNQIDQISEAMDYSSYEQHRPTYDKYVQTIDDRPTKPSFSEDRFRIRTVDAVPTKDYSMQSTRQGLWDSAMAGGVGNIWGNLTGDTSSNDGSDTSLPYSNPEWVKTNARFFDGRFMLDMERCNELTNGVCLQRPNNQDFIFYGENVSSLQLDLSGMSGAGTAVAVDAKKAYAEINLGTLQPIDQTWNAPYASDWAIAIGSFDDEPCVSGHTFDNQATHSMILEASMPYKIFLPIVANKACSN